MHQHLKQNTYLWSKVQHLASKLMQIIIFTQARCRGGWGRLHGTMKTLQWCCAKIMNAMWRNVPGR